MIPELKADGLKVDVLRCGLSPRLSVQNALRYALSASSAIIGVNLRLILPFFVRNALRLALCALPSAWVCG